MAIQMLSNSLTHFTSYVRGYVLVSLLTPSLGEYIFRYMCVDIH